MKVLVACEFSGIVRDAFLERGHDAISCDLLPTERPGPHFQGDVAPLLREPWDLVIAHPPCTYLSRARGKIAGLELVEEGIAFFRECLAANAPKVAVENPVPFRYVSDRIGRPDCKVDPYNFGDDYLKRTYWWLRGLPPLLATHYGGEDGSLPSLIASKSTYRKRGIAKGAGWGAGNPQRSRFHPGMAAAMADQWGTLPEWK